MLSHKTTLRVRYADTDKMQIVYNGKYLEYFEVGRAELLRYYGLPYSEVEKRGYQLPLLEAGVTYKSPAAYDDLLEVEASVSELFTAKIFIEYKIYKKDTGILIAEGFTKHMFIKSENQKPVRPPDFYINHLADYFKR